MGTQAIFPSARPEQGMYESFYLRAVSPTEPVALWVRHTVHKPPRRAATGSVWCTLFDARLGRPFAHKVSSPAPHVPAEGWIEIGSAAAMSGRGAEGTCGPARWSLRFRPRAGTLEHLHPKLLYRTPLPRTKLTSPAPLARFEGQVEIESRGPIDCTGWTGMIGHNWGSQHAERWIWLHGCGFGEDPAGWLDVALARVLVAGRLSPWLAAGALSLKGRIHRLGGMLSGSPTVREREDGCDVSLPAGHGLCLDVRATVPTASAAGWRYTDPDGGEHHVLNCSVAGLSLSLHGPSRRPSELHCAHGGVYELGGRDPIEGLAEADFPDG